MNPTSAALIQFFHEGKGFVKARTNCYGNKRTEAGYRAAVAPPSPAMTDGPVINGHSAIGDSRMSPLPPTLSRPEYQSARRRVYSAAQILKDRGRERPQDDFPDFRRCQRNTKQYHDYKSTVRSCCVTAFPSTALPSAAPIRTALQPPGRLPHDTGGSLLRGQAQHHEELYPASPKKLATNTPWPIRPPARIAPSTITPSKSA